MTSDYENTRNILLGMSVEAVMLEKELSGSVANYFGKWLTGQYAIIAREQLADFKGAERFKAIRAVVHDCSLLCRGEQNAERLRIERERLEVASRDADMKWKRKTIVGLEAFLTYVKHHPEAEAAFDALAATIRHPFDPTESHLGKNGFGAKPNPTKSD